MAQAQGVDVSLASSKDQVPKQPRSTGVVPPLMGSESDEDEHEVGACTTA